MRFTAFVGLAACQSMAMRPEISRAAVSKRIATIGDLVPQLSSSSGSLAALKAASAEVSSILAEAGGPDDHISDDDAALLRQVIDLVDKTIYSSMDASHNADVAALAAAVDAAAACNADITQRQAPEGDLGALHQHVKDKQTELDRLQGVVDEKTEANNTKWEEFDSHMQMIAAAPACPDFPARTMPALDVYFEKSEYSIWFAAQQASYDAMRDAFTAADSALTDAIRAYNIQKAVRDIQYCDWKSELEAACAAFDKCFTDATVFFNSVLVPRVEKDMASRIEVKKAGDTLIHQINFLLGTAENQETPPIDVSRYMIAFPSLPAKGLCDLSPLDADEWVPTVTCSSHRLVDGCARGGDLFPAWGLPRTAMDDERAGEAVCCNEKGVATRNIRRHTGLFDQGLSHVDCTTTKTTQLINGKDSPSHTFFEAQAICTNAGLRLCRTQEEMDTSCNTGCHINFALAWLDDVPFTYHPTTVGEAWLNHFEAFGAQDVDKIMLDYDEDTVLQIHNDACGPDRDGFLAEFKGLAPIRQFFTDLFVTLTPTPGLNVPAFAGDAANPTVDDATVGSSLDAANVFLVWQSVDQGIEKATDTFLWKEVMGVDGGKIMIKKQNIVATQPSACPADFTANPPAPNADPSSPVTMGWNNHFEAFGAQDLNKILADYTESSTVQVFAWDQAEGEGYTVYSGLSAISGMFTQLWQDMNAAAVDGDIGLGVATEFPRVETAMEEVFLVWYSNSNPKATDTFLFDSAGKITRQTIVTTLAPKKTTPSTLFVPSFSVYPGYTGGLTVQGQMTVHSEGEGADAAQTLTWSLTGLDKACFEGAADDVKNGCGIHIHSGTSCEDAATVGGHYYSDALGADPWSPVVYTSTDGLSTVHAGVRVITGLSSAEINGRVMVVHKLRSGTRIACGVIGTQTGTGDSLEVVDFNRYPGYEGPLQVSGTMKIRTESGTETSASQVLSWNLAGLDTACQAGAAEGISNGCGIHVHSGTSCESAADVGGHFFSSALETDPWKPVVYVAGPDGSAAEVSKVATGLSSADITGRVMVVHELKSGARIACGVIQGPHQKTPSTLFVPSFSKYPGYTGDLAVEGQMTVHSEGEGPAAVQTLTWSLTGLDTACSAGAADDVKNGCGIHIHSGKSCDDAATVGGHYYSDVLGADPWSPVVYTSTDGLSTEHAGVSVITGLSSAQIDGRVMVVHQLGSGARIACGVIGKQTGTGSSLAVMSWNRYPGYDGPLQVSGPIKVKTGSGTETSASQTLSWSLEGLDTACQAGAAEGISNGCGIHVHSGTSCENAADVGGHFFSAALEADPWKPVVYVAGPDGVAVQEATVATGLSSADITGRVMVVHELNSGARIACGVIERQP